MLSRQSLLFAIIGLPLPVSNRAFVHVVLDSFALVLVPNKLCQIKTKSGFNSEMKLIDFYLKYLCIRSRRRWYRINDNDWQHLNWIKNNLLITQSIFRLFWRWAFFYIMIYFVLSGHILTCMTSCHSWYI